MVRLRRDGITTEAGKVTVRAKRIRLNVGTLAVDCDAEGFGVVKLGGMELAGVAGVDVRIRAGEVPEVSVKLIPI